MRSFIMNAVKNALNVKRIDAVVLAGVANDGLDMRAHCPESRLHHAGIGLLVAYLAGAFAPCRRLAPVQAAQPGHEPGRRMGSTGSWRSTRRITSRSFTTA